MKYCNFCLQPDTRPGTRLSIDGLCPACIYSQNLNNIDWKERYEILQNIIEKKIKSKKNNLNIQKKSKFNKHYDCVIGVSGGKDSTRQALYVRDKLKLKPLLVCLAYPPEQITNLGASNISNLINLGFDVEILSLAPQNWKKLLKTAFMKYANWAKASEHALYATVPRIAIRYKIPIIFWLKSTLSIIIKILSIPAAQPIPHKSFPPRDFTNPSYLPPASTAFWLLLSVKIYSNAV